MDRVLTYSPVGVAFLLTIPRLLSAEFGLFDDAETLRIADALWGGEWEILSKEAANGRLRPVYWIQYALIYGLLGPEPVWFFLWHALLFALLTFELILLVRRSGGSRGQAWLAGLLFALSGPVFENIYTISKPELLQAALLLGAVLPFASPGPIAVPGRRLAGWGILAGIFVLLAIMAKETAVVMVPIAGIWLLFALARSSGKFKRREAERWGALLAASLMATAVYFVLRGQLLDLPITGGAYTNNFDLSFNRFIDSIIRWSGWLVRDFAWLAPLVLIAAIDLVRGRTEQLHLIVGAAVWIGFWIALYLPWEFTVEYYMLPVAIGMSVLASAIIVGALARPGNRIERPIVLSLLGIGTLLWLVTFPNNLTNVRQQLAVDDANARMLEYIRQAAGDDGLVIMNIQHENEYVYELRTHLQDVAGLEGVEVRAFDPKEGLPASQALIVSPMVENQPLLAVRMGVDESTQLGWNQSLQNAIGVGVRPDLKFEGAFPLAIVDLPRVLCPLLPKRGYCSSARPLVDTREFRYGWVIYRWQGELET